MFRAIDLQQTEQRMFRAGPVPCHTLIQFVGETPDAEVRIMHDQGICGGLIDLGECNQRNEKKKKF